MPVLGSESGDTSTTIRTVGRYSGSRTTRGVEPSSPNQEMSSRTRSIVTSPPSPAASAGICTATASDSPGGRERGSGVRPTPARPSGRTPLPLSLPPGESLAVAVQIPAEAAGEGGEVTIDLVREDISWFGELGSTPLVVRLPE